jgi:hemerythrin-like domain-containing protein
MSGPTRRDFLAAAGALLLGATTQTARAAAAEPKERFPVVPTEDLMREHGLLRRILGVYEEGMRRIIAGDEAQLAVESIASGARIVRRFVEDYHEKLEEEFLFPRFEKRGGALAGLVGTLRKQHQVGRVLTDRIVAATSGPPDAERRGLAESVRAFASMYRPHAAREDTVLFPALHTLVSANEYDSLGETFEKRERLLFGEGGFESILDQVDRLERGLGIEDLAKHTPSL